jgi:hypothetical protein
MGLHLADDALDAAMLLDELACSDREPGANSTSNQPIK